MGFIYKNHYTVEKARALLPQIRIWLQRLDELRGRLATVEERLADMASGGNDLGGETVNSSVRILAAVKDVLREFESREIQIKDLDRGLIDFPALKGGKEIFLCWEKDEDDIEFWHDLESGYSGREPL